MEKLKTRTVTTRPSAVLGKAAIDLSKTLEVTAEAAIDLSSKNEMSRRGFRKI